MHLTNAGINEYLDTYANLRSSFDFFKLLL